MISHLSDVVVSQTQLSMRDPQHKKLGRVKEETKSFLLMPVDVLNALCMVLKKY